MLIEFKEALTDSDRLYLKACYNTNNIGKRSLIIDTYIIYSGNHRLGVFIANITRDNNVQFSEPIIYLQHFSIFTQAVFKKVLVFLFFDMKVNFLLIKIYNTNKLMINLANNFNFNFCGEIKDVDILGRGICFYQLDKKDILELFKNEDELI
ncbi:hypothetical protein HU830_01550 [Lactobacillus sp. DCY120]|uniref:N-acetyltransferase domain-containing protein n=1 Tax=Bombilactobacillus apium TaxID=2675299 RepID=A0A850R907_9LACO|nr:hypothetical protein [Bombilactobacillus apium]NVY95886.1 hypothetical protein [Bombilactobacillus apium]